MGSLPLINSRLLFDYANFNLKIKIIMVIIKYWAKKKYLIGQREKKLSSYAFVILTIFYFQQQGYLPCLQSEELQNTISIEEISLKELFKGFLQFYVDFFSTKSKVVD